jgi:DNA-binding Lrp family transcriptional regulator
MAAAAQVSQHTTPRWDFLTNHAHVLVCVARDPGIRLRDIATAVGITERGAHRIVSELVDEGYVVREPGRRNPLGKVSCRSTPGRRLRSATCSRSWSAGHGDLRQGRLG